MGPVENNIMKAVLSRHSHALSVGYVFCRQICDSMRLRRKKDRGVLSVT